MLQSQQTLEGHTDRVWTLAWNPTGTILASSGADKLIRLWARDKSDKWFCAAILAETHNKTIRRLCWSPCGNYLASASFDSTVCIWKQQVIDGSWLTIVNLEGHESEVKSVAWSSDGNYLASCGRDRTIWIWERATDENDDRDFEGTDSAENWDCSDVKNDHTKDVKHILWHPLHPILASCSYDDTVKLFHKDGDDWTCFETLSVHTSTVWSADFSATGQHLVTCGDDRTVRVWKNHSHDTLPEVVPNSWKCVSVIQGYHCRSVYDVSWSKLDNTIASGSGDNSIAIYRADPDEASDGCDMFTCAYKLARAHDCDVNCVVWNPKVPKFLASAGDDRKIKLWNYSDSDKGTKPQTVVDELLTKLSKSQIETNSESSNNMSQTKQTTADQAVVINIENSKDLISTISSIQQLKGEIFQDIDRQLLEKLLDLRFTAQNLLAVDVTNLKFNDQDPSNVEKIIVEICDETGTLKHKFELVLGASEFVLKLPRRTSKMTVISDVMFLIDKTGDLYQVHSDGTCRFLLGHLFTFADVQFMTKKGTTLSYIISADRDEKIRISNYPNTYDIERFCFGHRNFLRRLLVVDEDRFVSIDQKDEICLWNLNILESSRSDSKPLVPERTISLNENVKKRLCVR